MSRSESAFVNRCDRQVLQHWAQLFFTSNRIAINAVNVNHSSFMNLLEKQTNLLPNTTVQHFPTPQASYIAKESHITHRSALNLPDNAGLVDQHVGVAFLAPNKAHPDYASTLVINSMLSTGFIYDRRGAHVSSPPTPQRTPNTRNSHHHVHKQQFDLQINSNFHTFQENHPHHDHISPFLQHVDTTYFPYNDSGLLVAQTNLSTSSTQARDDSIAMMQEYLKSHSTELLPAELVENHKSRVLLNMLNYLGSNQVNLAATLSSTLSTRQFDERAELTRQNKPDNITPLQSFKWDPFLSHDPIDQAYAAIQQVTQSDIQRVLTTILNSPPTIVSYTAARHHHA
jgi:predicted Zn-dependent peptidase